MQPINRGCRAGQASALNCCTTPVSMEVTLTNGTPDNPGTSVSMRLCGRHAAILISQWGTGERIIPATITPLDGTVPDFLQPDSPEWMTAYSERHLVRGEN